MIGALYRAPYTPRRDNVGDFFANFRRPKMIIFFGFWSLKLFFEIQDPENRIREVQLVYREVVLRLFDPPDRWNKSIFLTWSL